MSIAVLLDLDNIKPKLADIERICQTHHEKHGQLVVRRAFSNTPSVLTAYGGAFREFCYGFELTPGLTPVPQEVDRIIEERAEEITGNLDYQISLIAVVSNDNGYASLFGRLKGKGIETLVIGDRIGNKLREAADYVEPLKEVMRPTYVGIDLGTTNTVMALANVNLMTKQWTAAAVGVSIRDEQGSLVTNDIIPSAVRFHGQTEAEVGGYVKAQAYAFRDRTILAWKHDMGRSIDGKQFAYDLTSGKVFPEEAAAKVLAFCRDKLIGKYGSVQGAVITHPASYESDAIEATRKAAVLAGWQEEEVVLLPEPQAALYDYLHRVQKGELTPLFDVMQPSNILVYDLGGGTLDITLHNVLWEPSASFFIIDDLAIGSRTRVGGDTIDRLIANYILDNWPACKNLSEADAQKLAYELPIFSEKFKKAWGAEYDSTGDKDNFKHPFQATFLEGQFPIRYYISKSQMAEILSPLLCEDLTLASGTALDPQRAFDEPAFTNLLNTLIVPVLEVILKAKQSSGEIPKIDAVLLNGGMTYFPPVRDRLQRLFGDVPIIDGHNPDRAVARGAALYAAGALKSTQRVNPTNIYLEVLEGKRSLRLLVAQGQKYPYRTVLSGLKLPDTSSGYLSFKVWVGMGTKPNQNTTLQRLRQVAIEEINGANLPPNCTLNLEVEYTFDERLLLTLTPKEGSEARFKLDVASPGGLDKPPSIVSPQGIEKLSIPSIPRLRKGKPITERVRVNFNQWEALANSFNNHGPAHQERRELEKTTAIAKNRLAIIGELLRWLEMSGMVNSLSETKALLAVMALSTIFQSIDYTEANNLEKKFQQWIKSNLTSGLLTSKKNKHGLYESIAQTPGKLCWHGLDKEIVKAFNSDKHKKRSESFINSLGKCGQPSQTTLNFLYDTMTNGQHLGQRMKAAWALGRLISPGQPERWQAKQTDVEQAAQLVLNKLDDRRTDPRETLCLLSCLSHCVAWHTTGVSLSQEICDRVIILPETILTVDRQLQKYPAIKRNFDRRRSLLPKLLNISGASSEERSQITEWLLEVVKD